MSEGEIVITLVVIIFMFFVLYNLVWRDKPRKLKLPKYNLEKHRLLKKEKEILADLVKDMKQNPGHWVKNGYCPITFQGPVVVNDHSSIGIQYSLQGSGVPSTILVHFNLANKTKFDQGDENSIATRIEGKHAQKFINTVTKIMDERGKELDYFRSRINKRL